jgi:hypothetical protein
MSTRMNADTTTSWGDYSSAREQFRQALFVVSACIRVQIRVIRVWLWSLRLSSWWQEQVPRLHARSVILRVYGAAGPAKSCAKDAICVGPKEFTVTCIPEA